MFNQRFCKNLARAACAGMCRHVPVRATVHANVLNRNLVQWRESGALSDAEFSRAKARLGF